MESLNKQLLSSWNINSNAWTESIRQEKIISRNTVTNPAIIRTILLNNPLKVLDVGCGEGWLARELVQSNIQVVGIDGSQSLIEHARDLGGGEFYLLDYDQFSNNPSQVGDNFDVIVFNFSLLSDDIQSVLKASKKVLKNNGRVIIQTLHPIAIIQNERYECGWKTENFEGMGEGYQASMPWYYRTLTSWVKEIQSAGLQILDCDEPIDTNTGKPNSLIFTLK